MAKAAVNTLNPMAAQPLSWPMQAVVVVSASLFVALCARITVPLPFTPVPLTMQNFAVLLVGMVLGSRRGFAAMALYLFQGAAGMPVFNPTGPGGIAQLLGPTGGFLMAYPVVAFVAGWLTERAERTFLRSALAGLAAEVWLFAGGLGWLVYLTHSAGMALRLGLYWFLFAEVIKILLAARVSTALRRNFRVA